MLNASAQKEKKKKGKETKNNPVSKKKYFWF